MDHPQISALLLLDLPEQALAGIDLLSFTTTPRFKGVKNIPAGLHFAFVGTSSTFSERHGIWFDVNNDDRPQPSLFIAQWDPQIETLKAVTDTAELLKWRANLGALWHESLTPYRQSTAVITEVGDDEAQEELIDWPKLVNYITPSLLSRITSDATTPSSSSWTLNSSSSAKRDLEAIPGLNNVDLNISTEKELNFLPIDLRQTWREGATGRERTNAAQDRSWALQHLLSTHCTSPFDILGELQFCFLMILTLNNFSCLEQWKRILTLLLTCRSAVAAEATSSDLFVQLLKLLLLQLQHCRVSSDTGLIDLADEGGSLLKSLLARFRTGVQTLPGSLAVQHVLDELDELEDYLRVEHGWQFGGAFAKAGILELEDGERVSVETTAFDEEDETGEYAPVVVELTDEQARLLGLEGEGLTSRLSQTSLRDVAREVVSDDEEEEDGGGDDDQDEVRIGAEDRHHKNSKNDEGRSEEDEDEEDEEEDDRDIEGLDARY